MRKKLKELIENAPIITSGTFSSFLIVSNGEYNGFWGKTGYDNIMVFAKPWMQKTYYKLSTHADKLTIFDMKNAGTFNLDIPKEYGVPRIWFHHPVEIDYGIPTADLMGKVIEEGD